MIKSNLLLTTSVGCFSRMSRSERAAGRFMRSEEGHAPAAPAAPDASAPAVVDAAAPETATAPEAVAETEAVSILGGAKVADPAAPAVEGEGEPDVVDPNAPPAEAAPYEGLTPPEGFAALDTEALAAAAPLMRAFGVADDKAQDFINQAAPVIGGMVEKAIAAHNEAAVTRQAEIAAEWATQAKNDPEVGGAHYDRSVSRSALALDTYASDDLRAYLTASGLGNHPEMIRTFAKIGATLEQGDVITGEPAPIAKGHPLYDDVYLPPEQRRG